MQVGRLNQRIIIQNYSETQNSFGEVVRSYSTLYTRWAQVKPTGGNESIQADEKVASRIAEFTIRMQGTTIDEKMRIVWNDYTWEIVSIDEIGINLKEGYRITAVSKDSQ
jgi:SPP1 family predicted phage head-tail adaptor